MLVNFFGPYKTDNGPVAVKCKKNYILKYDFFFAQNCQIHQENQSKNFYISKCHTLQNVKFEMSEYSKTTNTLTSRILHFKR